MNNFSGCNHRRTGVKAAAVLVGAVVVIGLTGCSGGSSNPTATPTATTSPTMTAPATSGHPYSITGKITAEDGSTWTVTADDGKQYNVTITTQTRFGTKQAPLTPVQFPVGSTVRISGATTGYTFTATRVTAPGANNPTNPSSTPPTS
jgi:hypothetical protein